LKKGSNAISTGHIYKAGLIYLEEGDRKRVLEAYEDLKRTDSKELEKALFKGIYPELK